MVVKRSYMPEAGVICSNGKTISGVIRMGELPPGDWVMAVMFKTIVVLVDRSGQNLPFIVYKDKMEQMKL